MRRLSISLSVALVIAGCGRDNSAATPQTLAADSERAIGELTLEVQALRRAVDVLSMLGAPSAILQRLDTAEQRLGRLEAHLLSAGSTGPLHLFAKVGAPPTEIDLGLYAGGELAYVDTMAAVADYTRPVSLLFADEMCQTTAYYPAADARVSGIAIGPDSTWLRPDETSPIDVVVRAVRLLTKQRGACAALAAPAHESAVSFVDTGVAASIHERSALRIGHL